MTIASSELKKLVDHIIHFLHTDEHCQNSCFQSSSLILRCGKTLLPTILSSLLLTLIIRILHTITKPINILLHTSVVILYIILSTLPFILHTPNLIANPVCCSTQATSNVRGNVFGRVDGVVEALFGVASEVRGGVFDGLFVAAEGVAEGLFFVIEGVVGAVVGALCEWRWGLVMSLGSEGKRESYQLGLRCRRRSEPRSHRSRCCCRSWT